MAISRGFARAVFKSGHRVLACAILPDHVHLVVRSSSVGPRRIVGHMKREAALELVNYGLHPFPRGKDGRLPSCWAEGAWCVYLEAEPDVRRAVRYVEENPLKEGKRFQRWSFVERA